MFIGVARHCIEPAIICLSNLLDLKPYLASSYTQFLLGFYSLILALWHPIGSAFCSVLIFDACPFISECLSRSNVRGARFLELNARVRGFRVFCCFYRVGGIPQLDNLEKSIRVPG